jgi:tRNA 2-thiouridine synthesizing protein A
MSFLFLGSVKGCREPVVERPPWSYDREFDGGDTGCGELLLDLRLFFKPLAAGSRVLVITGDAGAPLEMPAWCRMAGHRLIMTEHPFYLVEKRR